MINEVNNYIAQQDAARQPIMKEIHAIIVQSDKTIVPVVEPMMGKEMIIYKGKGMMKYALSSVKNHISLHVLPIYGSSTLYAKYQALLPLATFQKGCINFTTADQVPLPIVEQLFTDCAGIDLIKIREDYLQAKKEQRKSEKKKLLQKKG